MTKATTPATNPTLAALAAAQASQAGNQAATEQEQPAQEQTAFEKLLTEVPELPISGSSLHLGDHILLGDSVYKVTKLPATEEPKRKDRDPVHVPGSCTLVSGRSLSKRITLWSYNNYQVVARPEGGQAEIVSGQSTTGNIRS